MWINRDLPRSFPLRPLVKCSFKRTTANRFLTQPSYTIFPLAARLLPAKAALWGLPAISGSRGGSALPPARLAAVWPSPLHHCQGVLSPSCSSPAPERIPLLTWFLESCSVTAQPLPLQSGASQESSWQVAVCVEGGLEGSEASRSQTQSQHAAPLVLVMALFPSQASRDTKVAWKLDQTSGCSRVLLQSGTITRRMQFPYYVK